MPGEAERPPGESWASLLGDADALHARGLFVAEGRRVIQEILDGAAGGPEAIVAALGTPAAVEALDLAQRLAGRLDVRSPADMQVLTGFNFHRGALALVRRPPPLSVASLMGWSGAPWVRTHPPQYVVCEQIADADNVGSLFRNARAFGAAAVLLDDKSADPLYRKAVRTSLGAVLRVPWAREPLPGILGELARRGVVTLGLTPDPAAPTLAEALDGPQAGPGRLAPMALLVGNEGAGLSVAARAACDGLARIPMSPGADSLNVATALAVALYECRRLRT